MQFFLFYIYSSSLTLFLFLILIKIQRVSLSRLFSSAAALLLLCGGITSPSLLAKSNNDQNAFLNSISQLSEANDFGFKHLPFLHVKISQAAFTAVQQRYITQYNTLDNNTIAWQANNDGTHMNAAGYVGIGLGSFIWYGANNQENYIEDWPSVAQALQNQGVSLPVWALGVCPWSTEAEFDAANTPGSPYYADIQSLNSTLQTNPVALHVQFLYGAWARLLRGVTPNSDTPADYTFGYDPIKSPLAIISLPAGEAGLVGANFSAVATVQDVDGNPDGLFALMDYDNFKGEGTCVTEMHNTQHWGTLSVLENMGQPETQQGNPLQNFINSALVVLQNRITNTEMESKRNNTPVTNQNYDPTTDRVKYMTMWQTHLNGYINHDWTVDSSVQ